MSARLNVKVIPGAKQNAVSEKDGVLIVRVTAPAVDGRANVATLRLLAEYFGLAVSRLRIIRGDTSRRKIVERT